MKKKLLTIIYVLSLLRLLPHIILIFTHSNKSIIKLDIARWITLYNMNNSTLWGFISLMTDHPEYRNLFYYRIGHYTHLINFLCPKMNTLFIHCPNIGSGLFIQHGFATIISAKSIGRNCWINQQVTIGYSNKTDCPTIGDDVTINAGAKVIGKVHLGNSSIIGANAVVVKDIPECCTVVGIPAYIIRKNGMRCKDIL